MSDTPSNLWQQAWYPVAYLRDLDPQVPQRFVLLGQPLVIWFERGEGIWRVFADVCPHRLVPLSEGRLSSDGQLECPYHGWQFDGAGHCTLIPQAAADLTPPARAQCRSYAAREAQGLLFVFSGAAELAEAHPLPVLPLLDEPSWLVQDTFRDLPYDAVTLLENVLDVSHVPFTHHGTVGKRSNAGPVELELIEQGPEGFTGIWQEGPRRGKLGTQHTTFIAPGLMWHDLTAKGFARILTVVYATPMQPGQCRVFARFPFQFEQKLAARLLKLRPQWLQHIGNHRVLEDDQIFLHYQERDVERQGGSANYSRSCVLPTSSDRYVLALHQWINRYGGVPFPGQSLPPQETSLEKLLDRYDSHTRHCRSCSAALLQIRRFRRLGPVLIVMALLVLALSSAALLQLGLVVIVLLLVLGLRQAAIWERGLTQGERHPPRNA
jgi:phenylpropionate dioxygenase-like ring-hydroxylating dioxygenase large terminal subunit